MGLLGGWAAQAPLREIARELQAGVEEALGPRGQGDAALVEEHGVDVRLLAVVLDAEDADALGLDLAPGDERLEAEDKVLAVGLDVGAVAALDRGDEYVREARLG